MRYLSELLDSQDDHRHLQIESAISAVLNPSIVQDLLDILPEQKAAIKRQWNLESIIEMQNKKLQKLICEAYYNSPYYHEMFVKLNIHPESAKTIDDLQRLPSLTSDTLREYQSSILAADVMEESGLKAYLSQSSGTSGYAKTVFHLENDLVVKAAVQYRQFHSWFDDEKVITWIDQEKDSTFLAYHTGWHCYQSYTPGEVAQYPKLLSATDVLIGHPYFLKYIARSFQSQKIYLDIDAVITTYDFLDVETRACLKKAFGSNIYEFITMSELSVPTAWECETHRGLHVNNDYVIVEILNVDCDQPVPIGSVGEIAVTDLHNSLMPLIRYRTGDLAAWILEPCLCGRPMPLITSLLGRLSSSIRTNDGFFLLQDLFEITAPLGIGDVELIYSSSENTAILEIGNHVRHMIVDIEDYILPLEMILGCKVQIVFVDAVETTSTGKFRSIITKEENERR